MAWKEEKEKLAADITPRLHKGGFIETIFNARDPKYREKGWILKSGIWSPWYFNLRPIGDEPGLLADIGYALALMFENEMPEINKLLGVDMAGIPIATATSIVYKERMGKDLPFCYTRPFPGVQPRTPEAAEELFSGESPFEWGEHELIEGRINPGDSFAVWDDMTTNLGSKLITRVKLMHTATNKLCYKTSDVTCSYVGVVVDREQGAAEEGLKHDPPIHLSALIPFKSRALGWLRPAMQKDEFAVISDYQSDPGRYKGAQNELRDYVLKNRRLPG